MRTKRVKQEEAWTYLEAKQLLGQVSYKRAMMEECFPVAVGICDLLKEMITAGKRMYFRTAARQ